ncbi:MAG: DNA starvation/stationary phase protection protein [Acetobacter sp.]|nr:DNA starvation/stationary phase protection protein [Acetobacter sp.]
MANKIDKLNVFLANLAVMNIKVHNLHWNVVGPNFPVIHKMTEEIYKMFQCQFDELAEVMKTQNRMPMGTMAQFLENTTVEEVEPRDYTGYEVIDELASDCENIMAMAKDIRDEADKKDDFQIANLFEDYLALYAKQAWIIRAMQEEDAIEIEELEGDDDDDDSEDEE